MEKHLMSLYQKLAIKDSEVVQRTAHEIAEYMCGLDSARMIRLSERFRECSSMDWSISWERVDLWFWREIIETREDYLWVVRLGTFHPNGYFREKCIRELARDDDSVRFVLLRLNDWVRDVRKVAETTSARITELKVEELVSCLPYLEKVKQGRRRDNDTLIKLEQCIKGRIQEELKNVDLQNLRKYDLVTRKYLYRLLLERKLLSRKEINQMLAREKNGQCQFLLMTMFLGCYEFSVEELDAYLVHKSKVVQRKALEKKYSMVGTYWEGLEKMLLASSAGVRGQVSYILQKHTNIDIVEYYVQRLETLQKKVCILGIGENGTTKDAAVLFKYLEEPGEGIVKSALHAISMLLGFKASDIFWKYLHDERLVVMRAAYREIVANNIVFGAKQVFELFMETQSEALREKLAYLLIREQSWDRLPYVLQLYWYEDEHIQKVIQRGVYGRSVYGLISMEAADYIRSIMYDEKYNIPKHLQKGIEFDLRFVVKG